jgi:hypothetical protein
LYSSARFFRPALLRAAISSFSSFASSSTHLRGHTGVRPWHESMAFWISWSTWSGWRWSGRSGRLLLNKKLIRDSIQQIFIYFLSLLFYDVYNQKSTHCAAIVQYWFTCAGVSWSSSRSRRSLA